MTGEFDPTPASNRIPEGRSVVVVSDLHLGGGEDPETVQRFCNFLDYIRTDFPSCRVECHTGDGFPDSCPATGRTLLPPARIILLGDILEIWDSRNIDRNSAFLDALFPILKLRDMDCEVIYVTGNHDEDVSEIVASIENILSPVNNRSGKTDSCFWKSQFELIYEPGMDGEMKVEGVGIQWNPGTSGKLEIRPRHYAPPGNDPEKRGIEIGGTHYAFVHGQQFDRHQITYTISKVIGNRFDPVDFLQDLACNSASRQIGIVAIAVNVIVTFVLAWFLCSNPEIAVPPLVGFWFGLSLIALFVYGTGLFLIKDRVNNPSSVLVAVMCAALAVCAIVSVIFLRFFELFLLAFFISLFLSITTAFPRLFAYLKRKGYNLVTSKSKSSDEIVDEKLFKDKNYRYGAEVLVFGHTHNPDFGVSNAHGKNTLLINSGTWVRDMKNIGMDTCDSFVYIDSDGACSLRWVDQPQKGMGHIECFCRKKDNLPVCHLQNFLRGEP